MYAAGDCTHLEIGGKWAAKMAEEAMFQGETIAENLWRDLRGMKPKPHKIRFSTNSPKMPSLIGKWNGCNDIRTEIFVPRKAPILDQEEN